jgi:hypothetical protein
MYLNIFQEILTVIYQKYALLADILSSLIVYFPVEFIVWDLGIFSFNNLKHLDIVIYEVYNFIVFIITL